MAKFLCRCGEVISLSGGIPNPVEWRFMSDRDFDDFAGMVNAEDVYRRCESFYRCPECDRLWVYWDGDDKDPVCYAPEPEPE